MGLVNGLVTTVFRIPSFITTLGMFFVLQGLNNLLISGHQLLAFDDHPSMSLLGTRITPTPFAMPRSRPVQASVPGGTTPIT